ncbi:MAG: TetR/AcrR family transcriptional regulator [Kiritimatiellae bacterium]|nr:TetR/AcrR family transcriptional regulator [Kiritimatiellia bacterium]
MSRKKTEENRLAIVRAAAKLFSDSDFDRVRMDEVAEAAHLGKGTLYRYFKDKDELYIAVHFHGMDMWMDELAKTAQAALRPSEKLKALLLKGMRFSSKHQSFWHLISRGNPCRKQRRMEEWEERRAKIRALAERIVAEGVAAGEFREVNRRLLVSVIRHCIFSEVKGMFPSQEAGAAQCVDLLLNGIRARSEEAPAAAGVAAGDGLGRLAR